jgi:hypothetical protein
MYIQYKEYHSVCPASELDWDSPNPSLESECVPPPKKQEGGGGGTLACRCGVGGVQIPTTLEKA